MSTCAHCKKELVRNKGEASRGFLRRKYCNWECVLLGKRAKMNAFKDSQAQANLSKAARMGGCIKITNAVLNPELVRKIRELNNPLGFSMKEISKHMKIKPDIVSKVLRRITWAHIN